MGFSPIYLLGVDMNYVDHGTAVKHDGRDWTSVSDDDPNHFDPRYFGKGRKYHYPRMKEHMLPSMDNARRITDILGTRVLNAGVGGALEAFERVDFRPLFTQDRATELALLLEAFGVTPQGSSLESTFPDARRISGPAEWDRRADHVITDVSAAVPLISKAIFTHIPCGPFGDRYLFVKRAE